MIKKIILTAVFGVLGLFCLTGTSSAFDEKPVANQCLSTDWPHETSDLKPDPSLYFGKLDNGFRYILKTNSEPRGRAAILLDVGAGSINEKENERGLAHFLEHMMFNGTTHYKPGELVDYFQSIGMSFGGDTNAATSFDNTVFKLILPNVMKETIAQGLLVMRDYADGALLLEEEVDRERGVILAEKTARDSAFYRSYVDRTAFAMKGTRIPERMVIGKKQVLENADSSDLKGFYQRWYRPDNMTLVMVGDFDQDAVRDLVERNFSSLSTDSNQPRCPEYGSVEHEGVEAFYRYEPELGSTDVSLEIILNEPASSDSLELEKQNIYRYMVAQIINNRLEKLEEAPQTPFTSARYYDHNSFERYRTIGISGKTDEKNWKETLAELDRVVRQALSFGFSEEELIRVKKELLSGLENSVLTRDTRNSIALAHQIVGSLEGNRVYQSPEQELKLYKPIIDGIRTGDLEEIMKNGWAHSSRLVQVLGNAKIEADNPEVYLLDYYQGLQGKDVSPPVKAEKIDFPYLDVPDQPGKPVETENFDDIGMTRYRYENGLVLNIRQTDFKENSVKMAVHFGDGLKSITHGGIELLGSAVVNGSGTGTLKLTQLKEVLAASSVSTAFRIGEESFFLEGEAVTKDFELMLQVIRTLLIDPGFRREEFDVAMKNYELMYQQLEKNVQGGMELEVEPFLAGKMPGFGLPPWQEFRKLTLEDVRQWLAPYFKDSQLEISIVGDIAPDQARDLISRYFGTLKRASYGLGSSGTPQFPGGEKLDVTVDSSVDKAIVTYAWKTDDFWDISRTRRLHVLAAVMEDRLLRTIREKLGASYSPAVYSSTSRVHDGYGTIVAQVVVDTESIALTQKEILKAAQSLAAQPITEDELNRAVRPIVTSLKDTVRSNNYWLHSVLSLSSRHPEQLAWAESIIGDYSSISASDIKLLADKYMTDDRLATAVVRPSLK